jgi:hypothetical protein
MLRKTNYLKKEIKQEIDKVCLKPETGFLSSRKLYKKLKQNDKNITLNEVKEYLHQQPTYQIAK